MLRRGARICWWLLVRVVDPSQLRHRLLLRQVLAGLLDASELHLLVLEGVHAIVGAGSAAHGGTALVVLLDRTASAWHRVVVQVLMALLVWAD